MKYFQSVSDSQLQSQALTVMSCMTPNTEVRFLCSHRALAVWAPQRRGLSLRTAVVVVIGIGLYNLSINMVTELCHVACITVISVNVVD